MSQPATNRRRLPLFTLRNGRIEEGASLHRQNPSAHIFLLSGHKVTIEGPDAEAVAHRILQWSAEQRP